MRKLFAGLAAAAMIATPTLAAAAPSTAASSLSLTNVRAGTSTSKDSQLAGFGAIGLVILAGIIAIPIIAVATDDDNDSSDSN